MSNKPLHSRLSVNPILVRRGIQVRIPLPPSTHVIPPPLPPVAPPPDIRPVRQPIARPQPLPARRPTPYVKHVNRTPPSPIVASRIVDLRNSGNQKLLVIVANGPSILEAPLERLKGYPHIDIMSINKPDPRLWPTTHWTFCDLSQYRRHLELWNNYHGILINSSAIDQTRPNSIRIRHLGGKGFSRDLAHGFHVGRSTVYASMQVAYYLGYDQVYLFGVDMSADQPGPLWFYGTNPDVPPAVRRTRFQLEAEFYDHAATLLEASERARFHFCSNVNPHGFVDKYRRLDHRTAVDHILAQ